MAEPYDLQAAEMPAAGMLAVIDLFTHACVAFEQALTRTDNMLDATDFTGSIHDLGFNAGRVRALSEALTLLTGSPEWRRQGDAVLAEYLQGTPLPEQEQGG